MFVCIMYFCRIYVKNGCSNRWYKANVNPENLLKIQLNNDIHNDIFDSSSYLAEHPWNNEAMLHDVYNNK